MLIGQLETKFLILIWRCSLIICGCKVQAYNLFFVFTAVMVMELHVMPFQCIYVNAIKAHHESAQWLEHLTGVQNLIGSIPVRFVS